MNDDRTTTPSFGHDGEEWQSRTMTKTQHFKEKNLQNLRPIVSYVENHNRISEFQTIFPASGHSIKIHISLFSKINPKRFVHSCWNIRSISFIRCTWNSMHRESKLVTIGSSYKEPRDNPILFSLSNRGKQLAPA